MKHFQLFFLLGLLFSCSDYSLKKVPKPDIVTTPDFINYGALLAGVDQESASIEITNVGTANLDIENIVLLAGDEMFTISSGYENKLSPGQSTVVDVSYAPITFSENVDTVRIYSNDPDEPIVEIEVSGLGDAPIIVVSPEYYSFSGIYVGCDGSAVIDVSNIGNIDLTIEDIDHLASLPADFSLYDYEPYYGMLPLVIPPGEQISLEVEYRPTDAFDDVGFIEIESNDPLLPIASSDHDGDGDYEKWMSDTFNQDEVVDVDILFVIDNSGSMMSNQTNFKTNFASFMSVFSGAGVDYRIAFITTDDPNFVNGQIISPSDPDPIGSVNDIVDMIGTSGNPNEKGLEQSLQSTVPGGDAGPGGAFLRDDARLVLIYVSDEPDHSTLLPSPTDYASHFRGLKTSADRLVAHAVAGDYPGGCVGNGSAQFGDGYYDVVNLLGGTFLSICASDWGMSMDTLARESVTQSTFILTEQAVEGTIEVTVDGIVTNDWFYDETINAIQFTVIPAERSVIDVNYAVWSCLGEE